MLNSQDNEELDNWFQRLNAPLKYLPPGERQQLHEEVRQHLDALAKANEELGSTQEEARQFALAQFGDPTKIGRRMAWEWRRGQELLSPDMAAVLYGIGVHVAASAGLVALFCIAAVLDYFSGERILGKAGGLVTAGYFVGIPILAGFKLGRKYPRQALTGAFYAFLVLPVLPLLSAAALSVVQTPGEMWRIAAAAVGASAGMLSLTCGAAYLASTMERGWYRPTWADFKITLPKRRRRVG